MFLNNEMRRRPRGRPQIRPDRETRKLLLGAAGHEFQACGYAGTSMNAVARHAGVSTRTMYRLFPTKAELFHQVVAHYVNDFMLAFAKEAADPAGLYEALWQLLAAYGELALSKTAVAMQRLTLAESRRFPELAGLFHDALRGLSDGMAAWLRRHQEKGLIELEDIIQAAGMLRGMMAMEPQRAVMLEQQSTPDPNQIAERAKRCAELFLHGCAVPAES